MKVHPYFQIIVIFLTPTPTYLHKNRVLKQKTIFIVDGIFIFDESWIFVLNQRENFPVRMGFFYILLNLA